jgi:hypothetical protein
MRGVGKAHVLLVSFPRFASLYEHLVHTHNSMVFEYEVKETRIVVVRLSCSWILPWRLNPARSAAVEWITVRTA